MPQNNFSKVSVIMFLRNFEGIYLSFCARLHVYRIIILPYFIGMNLREIAVRCPAAKTETGDIPKLGIVFGICFKKNSSYIMDETSTYQAQFPFNLLQVPYGFILVVCSLLDLN